MNISIKDGRTELWQWDTGRSIVLSDVSTVSRVDFCQTRKNAITVEKPNADGSWNVPDLLLTSANDIEVQAMYKDSHGSYTFASGTLKINPRTKPSNYIYTDAEISTFEKAITKIEEIADGVNKVNVRAWTVDNGLKIAVTDRDGITVVHTIVNGKDGKNGLAGMDAKPYDDKPIKDEIRKVVDLMGEKMQRIVLYLSQTGTTYHLRNKIGQDVSFQNLYDAVKDESNYVVVLFGNSKLRPQYVSANEIHCDGEDRDSQGTLFLRMIMTPSSLYYGTFRLADKGDIPSLDGYVKDTDYATSEKAGLVRTYSGYGTVMRSNSYIASSVRTKEQYASLDDQAFIGKGTFENIGDDYVYRHTRDWTLIGSIDMTNVLTGLNVNLTDYKELCIMGACQGTANSNLKSNITNIAMAVSATTLRRFLVHMETMGTGTSVYGRYGAGHTLSTVLSTSSLDNYKVSAITNIGFTDPSYLTSCDVKIYAR